MRLDRAAGAIGNSDNLLRVGHILFGERFAANFNDAALYFYRVCGHAMARRIERLTRSDVELPKMQSAYDVLSGYGAVVQRGAHMRASVVDGVKFSAYIEDCYSATGHICFYSFSKPDVDKFTDRIELHNLLFALNSFCRSTIVDPNYCSSQSYC